jgi:FkbM family methyltransferase
MTAVDYVAQPLAHGPDIARYVSPEHPAVVFDIGCHDGLDSIRYARLLPRARVFAFEALPEVFHSIADNLRRFECHSVEPFNWALAAQRGEADFFVSSGTPDDHRALEADWNYGNKSSSLLPPGEYPALCPWLKFERVIRVRTETLDNFCQEHGLEIIDFIHMDVQGAELEVLAGARRTLPAIRVIWLEAKTRPLYQGQPLKPDVQQFMAQHGFRMVKDTVGELTGDLMFVNAQLCPD